MPAPNKQLLVVGSGVFGTSSAVHFLKEGGWDVRVIDRAVEQPAVDAASTDINKIIRIDYADVEMAKLAFDALEEFQKPEWEGVYHNTGVVLIGPADKELSWIPDSMANLPTFNITPKPLPDAASIRKHFADQGLAHAVGTFDNRAGYFNPVGGWVEAERAIRIGHRMIADLGGSVEGGKEVEGLVLEGEEVKGVKLVGGEVITADLVIIATGAWTPSLFCLPSLGIASLLTASAQSVVKWVLTDEDELETQRRMPIMIDLSDGCYIFPPTDDGVVKSAIHHLGYVNPSEEKNGCSVPRTVLMPGGESGAIPKEMVVNLRAGVARAFPNVAKKMIDSTRACYYTETPNGDFLIDHHPTLKNLFFATGGSGHGFKFYSTIGSIVLDRYLDRLAPTLTQRFSFASRGANVGADTRAGVREGRKVLDVEGLCTPEDLGAPVP